MPRSVNCLRCLLDAWGHSCSASAPACTSATVPDTSPMLPQKCMSAQTPDVSGETHGGTAETPIGLPACTKDQAPFAQPPALWPSPLLAPATSLSTPQEPRPPVSLLGCRYAIVFVDNHTRMLWIKPLEVVWLQDQVPAHGQWHPRELHLPCILTVPCPSWHCPHYHDAAFPSAKQRCRASQPPVC